MAGFKSPARKGNKIMFNFTVDDAMKHVEANKDSVLHKVSVTNRDEAKALTDNLKKANENKSMEGLVFLSDNLIAYWKENFIPGKYAALSEEEQYKIATEIAVTQGILIKIFSEVLEGYYSIPKNNT